MGGCGWGIHSEPSALTTNTPTTHCQLLHLAIHAALSGVYRPQRKGRARTPPPHSLTRHWQLLNCSQPWLATRAALSSTSSTARSSMLRRCAASISCTAWAV